MDGSALCKTVTILTLWALLILITALSVACTWAYNQQYDKSGSDRVYSGTATILISIALCGASFGFCGFGIGGKPTKFGIGFLWKCYKECDADCEICIYCRVLALGGLTLIIVPSFGILQAISGGLMVQSLIISTATNVKVFAGFIAAFDFIAAICGFLCGPFLCIIVCQEDK